jgi:hypothetical protein
MRVIKATILPTHQSNHVGEATRRYAPASPARIQGRWDSRDLPLRKRKGFEEVRRLQSAACSQIRSPIASVCACTTEQSVYGLTCFETSYGVRQSMMPQKKTISFSAENGHSSSGGGRRIRTPRQRSGVALTCQCNRGFHGWQQCCRAACSAVMPALPLRSGSTKRGSRDLRDAGS